MGSSQDFFAKYFAKIFANLEGQDETASGLSLFIHLLLKKKKCLSSFIYYKKNLKFCCSVVAFETGSLLCITETLKLTLYHTILTFNDPQGKAFENILEKGNKRAKMALKRSPE